jgi:hypothetical protein
MAQGPRGVEGKKRVTIPSLPPKSLPPIPEGNEGILYISFRVEELRGEGSRRKTYSARRTHMYRVHSKVR